MELMGEPEESRPSAVAPTGRGFSLSGGVRRASPGAARQMDRRGEGTAEAPGLGGGGGVMGKRRHRGVGGGVRVTLAWFLTSNRPRASCTTAGGGGWAWPRGEVGSRVGVLWRGRGEEEEEDEGEEGEEE